MEINYPHLHRHEVFNEGILSPRIYSCYVWKFWANQFNRWFRIRVGSWYGYLVTVPLSPISSLLMTCYFLAKRPSLKLGLWSICWLNFAGSPGNELIEGSHVSGSTPTLRHIYAIVYVHSFK